MVGREIATGQDRFRMKTHSIFLAMLTACLGASGMFGLSISAATAASSAYTNLDANKCQLIDKSKEGDGEWARFRCPGYKGWRVQLDAGDLREWVRLRPRRSPKWATLRGPVTNFNRIGPKMEWRSRAKGGRPYAVIYRISTTRNDRRKNRSFLYVAKLGPGGICLVAIVHGTAKPTQNLAARRAADTLAAGFDCFQEKPLTLR